MVVTRVVLIRHAEPVSTTRGRVYGRLDVGLSPAGRAAAADLRPAVEAERAVACRTSPRARAVETATALGLDPVPDERLAEIDFGAFEGRTYDEIQAGHPELYDRWMAAPTTIRFPGGESYADVRVRALAALSELRVAHAGATSVVVTHGGVIRAIVGEVLVIPDERIFRLGQDYLGRTTIDWYDEEPVVRSVNVGPQVGH